MADRLVLIELCKARVMVTSYQRQAQFQEEVFKALDILGHKEQTKERRNPFRFPAALSRHCRS
jgi:hypothetical protein